jgi:hypothetical protein
MAEMLISISSDPASDSWGFVGVVRIGEAEAYRTLEAFPDPASAILAAQNLTAGVLGELLAGQEWRAVRDGKNTPPTRRDFNFSVLARNKQAAD